MRHRVFGSVVFSLSAAIMFAGGFPAGAQTTTTTGTPEERAAALTRPAVVYLEQYWRAWVKVPRSSDLYFQGYVNGGNPFEWSTRCSGFIVSPDGYIVTAGHCVDRGEEGARAKALAYATEWLIQNGWAYKRDFAHWLNEGHLLWGVEGFEKGSPPDLEVYVQRGVAAGGLKTGEAFPARIVEYQPLTQGDVALLKIEESDLPAVLVAPSGSISVGTDVLAVGYPGSSDAVTDATYEPTYKDGQVNSEKTREGGLLPVYEISAAMSGGMSGGPTVNMSGDVIGVNSFGIFGETEAFNFITPSSLVLEVMARNGVTNALGPIDEAYRAGIDAFFAGDYATAIARFDEVLAMSPTHQQAQEFKVEAAKLQQEQPPASDTDTGGKGTVPAAGEGGGFPAWAWAAIVGGVLVVGALVFVASRRRSPGPAAPAAVAPMPPAAAPAPPAVAPLHAVPSAPGSRFCANCGHELLVAAQFCPDCGHKVDAA